MSDHDLIVLVTLIAVIECPVCLLVGLCLGIWSANLRHKSLAVQGEQHD